MGKRRRSAVQIIVSFAVGALVSGVAVNAQSGGELGTFTGSRTPTGGYLFEPVTSSTTSTTSTTVPPATTTTVPAPTTTRPATTTTAPPAPTTTAAPATTTTTTAPPAGVMFTEAFTDPAAFEARFNHGWSGELRAGALFGADKSPFPADHDMSCGNPNTTRHDVTFADQPGDMFGERAPHAVIDRAFHACLPGGNPASGHVMTTANTEGYVVAWFSPKPVFSNVHRVCWDQNLTFLGNGQWTQLVFLTPVEYNRSVTVGGQPVSGDLGYTSPEFPTSGPSTPQGSAQYGVKVGVFHAGGPVDAAHSVVSMRPWAGGDFLGYPWDAPTFGAGTADKAPRYTICVTDNENGTLTLASETVAGGVDGPRTSATVAGSIPNGDIRVVFEHDEYNPDKHHSNEGELASNTGEGYTWHWDNVEVS
jgi:hypothetical protein